MLTDSGWVGKEPVNCNHRCNGWEDRQQDKEGYAGRNDDVTMFGDVVGRPTRCPSSPSRSAR
jgi:hypothetical protein